MDTNPIQTPAPAKEEPLRKYIRTFASDMDVSKKGGIPGLAPFDESRSGSTESSVSSSVSSITETSVLAEAPAPVPVTAPELTVPKPFPPIVPAPEPMAPPPPAEEPGPAPIETYSEDFRARVKETNASTAAILAAEQDASPRSAETVPEKRERNHNWLYISAGILLLGIGGVGVYIAYSRYLAALAPITIAPTAQSPIFVDSQETVSGTGEVLMQAIEQSVGKPLPLNTVRQLTFGTSTTTDIFLALDVPAPGILLRNLNRAAMAGVVNTSSGQGPFFILSVGSYSATFSGMLSWEPTMQSDLGALFPLYPVATAATSTATSTPVVLSKGSFHDETVSNHDVRVYRDAAGRSVLLYGYWNQDTLIIARDPAAFAEILGRLATSHA